MLLYTAAYMIISPITTSCHQLNQLERSAAFAPQRKSPIKMSLDVSPTYRSGDYFAPMAKPKRLAARRAQREFWGFHAKTYGGIGCLVFDSKFKVGRKGILVSRGHDHHGGGIHKFHPVKQPYQVTSLSKSACRPNDELVPDINKVDVISIARESNLLTKKASDHDCFQPIFEVFPNFDVNTQKQNMEPLTSKQKVLGAKNITALEDLNKKLYNTTSHRFDYDSQQATSKAEFKNDAEDALNEAKSEKTVRIKSPRPMSGRKQMYNDVWKNPNENNPKCVLCNCQINVSDFADGTADFPICNYCKSTGIFRLDFYDNPYAYRDQRSRLSEEAKHNIASLSLSELRRLTGSVVGRQGDKARAPDSGSDSNLVKLIKAPIEKTDLITSPLNYLGYYSGRQRNRLPSLIRKLPNSANFNQGIDDVATPHEALTPKRIPFTRVAVPVSLMDKQYLESKGICSSEHFLSKDGGKKGAKISEVMPDVHFPLCCEKEDDKTDEDNCKIPESMRKKLTAHEQVKTFRSLAHKRYHKDFPELIPDLRVSHKNSKKYFFYGYHTSVFRG